MPTPEQPSPIGSLEPVQQIEIVAAEKPTRVSLRDRWASLSERVGTTLTRVSKNIRAGLDRISPTSLPIAIEGAAQATEIGRSPEQSVQIETGKPYANQLSIDSLNARRKPTNELIRNVYATLNTQRSPFPRGELLQQSPYNPDLWIPQDSLWRRPARDRIDISRETDHPQRVIDGPIWLLTSLKLSSRFPFLHAESTDESARSFAFNPEGGIRLPFLTKRKVAKWLPEIPWVKFKPVNTIRAEEAYAQEFNSIVHNVPEKLLRNIFQIGKNTAEHRVVEFVTHLGTEAFKFFGSGSGLSRAIYIGLALYQGAPEQVIPNALFTASDFALYSLAVASLGVPVVGPALSAGVTVGTFLYNLYINNSLNRRFMATNDLIPAYAQQVLATNDQNAQVYKQVLRELQADPKRATYMRRLQAIAFALDPENGTNDKLITKYSAAIKKLRAIGEKLDTAVAEEQAITSEKIRWYNLIGHIAKYDAALNARHKRERLEKKFAKQDERAYDMMFPYDEAQRMINALAKANNIRPQIVR